MVVLSGLSNPSGSCIRILVASGFPLVFALCVCCVVMAQWGSSMNRWKFNALSSLYGHLPLPCITPSLLMWLVGGGLYVFYCTHTHTHSLWTNSTHAQWHTRTHIRYIVPTPFLYFHWVLLRFKHLVNLYIPPSKYYTKQLPNICTCIRKTLLFSVHLMIPDPAS